MRLRYIFSIIAVVLFFSTSCLKQEYFKSEGAIKEELNGTWTLIPIPKYDTSCCPQSVEMHHETWTFDDSKVTIVNGSLTSTSTYSVNTTISKAEIYLDGIIPEFIYPSRIRSSG